MATPVASRRNSRRVRAIRLLISYRWLMGSIPRLSHSSFPNIHTDVLRLVDVPTRPCVLSATSGKSSIAPALRPFYRRVREFGPIGSAHPQDSGSELWLSRIVGE